MKLSSAVHGIRCPRCNFIFWGKQSLTVGKNCPKCHMTIGSWKIFPPHTAELLLNKLEDYFSSGENEITVLISCVVLEILMEDFLKSFMQSQKMSNGFIKTILRKFWNITRRVDELFKSLIGKSFNTAIQGTDFKDFYNSWVKVRRKRDIFIHGNPYAIGPKIAQEAFSLAKSSFSLFAWLNNKYCI